MSGVVEARHGVLSARKSLARARTATAKVEARVKLQSANAKLKAVKLVSSGSGSMASKVFDLGASVGGSRPTTSVSGSRPTTSASVGGSRPSSKPKFTPSRPSIQTKASGGPRFTAMARPVQTVRQSAQASPSSDFGPAETEISPAAATPWYARTTTIAAAAALAALAGGVIWYRNR